MKIRSNFAFTIWLFLVSLYFSHSAIYKFSEEFRNGIKPIYKQESNFVCSCDGSKRTAVLSMLRMESIFEKIQNNTFCKYLYSKSKICSWLKECNTCKAEMRSCKFNQVANYSYDCFKKSYQMEGEYVMKEISGIFGKRYRNTRDVSSSSCTFPAQLQTASMYFVKYPSSIRATLKCIFGYTLPEGISRDMRCLFAENKWRPTGFEECKPFIDCTVALTSPGTLECTTGTPDKAPSCNITCGRYEDKPEVPNSVHECQIYGAWKPKLPFCAQAGTGIQLAPAPKVKLHPTKDELVKKKSRRPGQKT